MEKKNNLGIYIHIPFCKKKCLYCDFTSLENKENEISSYIYSLINEIKNYKEYLKMYSPDKFFCENKDRKRIVDTIYFGGGTPSFIDSKYIEKILKEIKKHFKISKNVEITIEVNPESMNEEKVKTYKKIGINRISSGLQTTNNFILKYIGRIHTYEDFIKSYNLYKDDFRTNIDLIFSLPYQTEEKVLLDLNNVISLNPDSISFYSLILHDNSKLKKKCKNKFMLDEEQERSVQKQIYKILNKNKYYMYEISNFAKKGKESKHNCNTWKQYEYIGFGISASSYINGIRFTKTKNISKYIDFFSKKDKFNDNDLIKNKIIDIEEKQTKIQAEKEHIMLGLRMKKYNTLDFFKKFNEKAENIFYQELKELNKKGLINIKPLKNNFNSISLTEKGLDLENQVSLYFI